MSTAFVSVLIDTYNHERFIEDAVNSVLAQDFPAADREILIVDDGSTDRTPEILNKFASKVCVLRKENGGQASAFNHGIPRCRGDIVTFLDGDDWWAPNKLSSVVGAFASNSAVGLVGSSITEVLADGRKRCELVRDCPRFRIDSLHGARIFRLRKSFLGTSRMAFRADLLRRIGPVPQTLRIEADEFLFTLGALFSEVLLLREPVCFYRLHGHNLFVLGDGNPESQRRKHDALVALADSLRERFRLEQVPSDVAAAVLESLQLDIDGLRLFLGDATRLDTVRTELRTYRITHEHASFLRRLLKYVSLFPALLLSPRQYVQWKHALGSSSFYRRTRAKVLPTIQPSHVDRTGDWSQR